MRVIILESTVYKVNERQFNDIKAKEAEINKYGYQPDNDIRMSEWLDEQRPYYIEVGMIDFDFRL